jgi:putative lipoic acid-binding regulatory protein
MANRSEDSLLEFPCRFPIKAMGRSESGFRDTVTMIVLSHADLWPGEPVRTQPSRAGNYVSVTTVIEATSREQLDSIYQELTDCEAVLMAF